MSLCEPTFPLHVLWLRLKDITNIMIQCLTLDNFTKAVFHTILCISLTIAKQFLG